MPSKNDKIFGLSPEIVFSQFGNLTASFDSATTPSSETTFSKIVMKRRNVPNKYSAVADNDDDDEAFANTALLGGAGSAGQKKRWISMKTVRKIMIVSVRGCELMTN